MEFLKDYINQKGVINTTTEQMPQQIKQHPKNPDSFLIEKQVNIWQEYPKTKPNLSKCVKIANPIAVLGGGPSLSEDLKHIPDDCFLISANHHAIRLVNPNIMCFLDPIDQQKGSDYYKAVTAPKRKYRNISLNELEHTDFYCVLEFPEELKPPGDSGRFALWVASYISTGDIYLCGIGLRQQGEQEHFYNEKPHTSWGGPTMEVKVKQWMKFIDYVGRERVKVVSGPLKEYI